MASLLQKSLLLTLLLLNLTTAYPQSQFITGPCTSDADCASGCCGFNTGKCAAPIVAAERDGGCGFGGEGTAVVADEVAAPVAVGTQFITGVCGGDEECASGCCGFNTGKCAAPLVAVERDGGCGFGGTAAVVDEVAGTVEEEVVAAAGTQFITGPCTSDADCASGCCGFNTGKCAGAIVALERDGGCGFGDEAPNDDAASVLRGE